MKKLLLIALLIVGCAVNTTYYNEDEIKSKCKIECDNFNNTSKDWCECMDTCSTEYLPQIGLGRTRLYIEECWSDSTNNE